MFMKELLLIFIKEKFQVKYWNVLNFPSMSGIRFWAGKQQISPELTLSLTSNSPEPPLKHPSEERAKSAPQAKNFHFSKWIYELL